MRLPLVVRLAAIIVRFVSSDAEPLLGDLEETFWNLASSRGIRAASAWYWKETIVTTFHWMQRQIGTYRLPLVTLLLGLLLGAFQVVLMMESRRAILGMYLYAVALVVLAVFVRAMRVEEMFHRFVLILFALLTAVLIHYAWALARHPIALSPHPLWGQVWRLAAATLIGSVFASVAAMYSGRRLSPMAVFPLVPIVLYTSTVGLRGGSSLGLKLLRFILPFGLVVNWRHDGWALAFAGMDVLLWSLAGYILGAGLYQRKPGKSLPIE